jgi:hypothetical protein
VSGFACLTVFASAVTITVVTGTVRLFTIVRTGAARDGARSAAVRGLVSGVAGAMVGGARPMVELEE